MFSGKLNLTIKTLLMMLAVAFMAPAAAQASLTAKANHDHIKIDFFYHGSTVSVRGVSDPGTDLIIKITSPEGHQALKEKGKAAGFLWMNVGELELDKTPNLYYVHGTKELEDIVGPEDRDKYVLGYAALGKHMEISPVKDPADRAKWFEEFVKYKESKKLYQSGSGKIAVDERDGQQKYYILFDWPYQAPPGNYLVTVYEVKDRKVIEQAESKVLVEQVGMVKLLSDMSKNNGMLYGIISIISAVGAGFGVGLVFRKGGGAH